MIVYTYFISYTNHENSTLKGIGRVEVTRNRKVKTIEDVEDMEKTIAEKYGYGLVIINNYILLSRKLRWWKKWK